MAEQKEQVVAGAIRNNLESHGAETRDGEEVWPIPGGGVMLRHDGYQFSVEVGENLERFVVLIYREPVGAKSRPENPNG